MRFKINDWVVHLQHGIGRVAKLGMRDFGSVAEQRYYEIAIPSGTLWVPVKGAEHVLRKITPKVELTKYRVLLRTNPTPLARDYRERQAALTERLSIGSFRAKCEVLRDLSAHSQQKSLNETGGDMLRKTWRMVRDEWAIAADLSPSDAAQEIEDLLRRGRKTPASES